MSGPRLKKRRRWFSGKRTRLRAETCVSCGLTVLFADEPHAIFPGSEAAVELGT